MSSDPLESIRLKLDRAQVHRDAIRVMLRPFDDGEIQILREKDEHRDDWYTLRIILPESDRTLPVIIGDCLHNIRSPLDHLVYQLVKLNGHTPARSNQFPICESPDGFKRHLMRDSLCGVHIKDKRLIETLQPYSLDPRNPRAHPLWILNELMNTDKHRTLNTITMTATNITAFFGGHRSDNISEHGGIESRGTLYRNRGVLMQGILSAVGGQPQVRGQGAMFIAFQEPVALDMAVEATLQQMHQFVRDTLIPAFEPRFS
jgi:hypothetical protein